MSFWKIYLTKCAGDSVCLVFAAYLAHASWSGADNGDAVKPGTVGAAVFGLWQFFTLILLAAVLVKFVLDYFIAEREATTYFLQKS